MEKKSNVLKTTAHSSKDFDIITSIQLELRPSPLQIDLFRLLGWNVQVIGRPVTEWASFMDGSWQIYSWTGENLVLSKEPDTLEQMDFMQDDLVKPLCFSI